MYRPKQNQIDCIFDIRDHRRKQDVLNNIFCKPQTSLQNVSNGLQNVLDALKFLLTFLVYKMCLNVYKILLVEDQKEKCLNQNQDCSGPNWFFPTSGKWCVFFQLKKLVSVSFEYKTISMFKNA